jgi:hypothetical protein
MKKFTLFFVCCVLIGGFVMAQETLTWRFANPQVISGSPDIFQFDVQVKASAAGTFQRDLQVYFDYNTAAFGADIVANGKIAVSELELMNNASFPSATYSIVNSADNTSSKFAVITEADNELTQSGTTTYFLEMPTEFTGLLRFQIDIANAAELAGISFDATLMDGGQYKQSTSNTDPVKYAEAAVYDNDLTNASLEGLLFSSLKCFIEGPYDAGTGNIMNTDLLAGGYLPFGQPFNPALPYYDNASPVWLYGGSETVSAFPANTVDWVLVQLRDAADAASAGSGAIMGSEAALLLDNGSIVDVDGNPLVIKESYNSGLFVVIYHRNHLGVISNFNVGINGTGTYEYDFSDAVDKSYGGSNGHKDLGGGVYGLISADGNGNGLIQNTDETAVWKADLGGSGYQGGDFNLNALTQNTDETNYWKPNLGGGGQVPSKSADTGYKSQIPK